MLPDRLSNPGPLTYESGALPIALRGPAVFLFQFLFCYILERKDNDCATRPGSILVSISFLLYIGKER